MSDSQFKPDFEGKDIEILYHKILKYIGIPRYKDIIYFFLLPRDTLRTMTSMGGEQHLMLIETIGYVDKEELLRIADIHRADLVEFLTTPIGRKLMKYFPAGISTVTDLRQFISLMEEVMSQIPEFQEVLGEMAKSEIPVILPLSLYRSWIVGTALTLHRLYENLQFKDKIPAIISILSREGLVEPIYQVEVCCREDCSFVKTSVPADPANKREYLCPMCRSRMLVFKVYAVDSALSRLKLNRGIDLPIFIREYLRFRGLGKVNVCAPCLYGNDELDVVLPERKIGIECKLYKIRVFTEHDIRSQAGNLANEIRKYWNASLNEVFLVTNLDERSAETLEQELSKQIPEGKTVKVIPGDADALITMLNSLI